MINRNNNFDLIRILAAIQVLLFHSTYHLEISNETFKFFAIDFLKHLPGVPIFFVVSGFLVYWSFERNSDKLLKYFWHRALRIFPALWICILITFALLIHDLGLSWSDLNQQVFAWLAGQLTIAQFYTPDIFRAWGVGTPNGSLWTIPVELQFYLLIPFLFLFFKSFKKKWYLSFAIVFIISLLVNIFIKGFDTEMMIRKLGNVFILSYLYYFLFGVLAYKYWDRIRHLFEGKLFIWLLAYTFYVLVFSLGLKLYGPSYWVHNPFNFIAHIILAGMTLAFAFTNNNLSHRLLKGNDISYGVYIYHMVVVNFLVQRGLIGELKYVLVAFVVSFFLAVCSWKFIETKALKLKSLLK